LFTQEKASLRDLLSLLGKLHFVSNCVRPGSPLLNWLHQAFPSNIVGSGHKIFRRSPKDIKKDLLWWYKFLPGNNGFSIMSLENWSSPDEVLSSDACLDEFGAISSNQFCHALFPSFIKENQLHINCLELLAIIIATKIWGHKFKGKTY
jgi:hypothetical protein